MNFEWKCFPLVVNLEVVFFSKILISNWWKLKSIPNFTNKLFIALWSSVQSEHLQIQTTWVQIRVRLFLLFLILSFLIAYEKSKPNLDLKTNFIYSDSKPKFKKFLSPDPDSLQLFFQQTMGPIQIFPWSTICSIKKPKRPQKLSGSNQLYFQNCPGPTIFKLSIWIWERCLAKELV